MQHCRNIMYHNVYCSTLKLYNTDINCSNLQVGVMYSLLSYTQYICLSVKFIPTVIIIPLLLFYSRSTKKPQEYKLRVCDRP